MNIETFYNRAKLDCELPVANITYITLKENNYSFFAVPISLRDSDKEETLKTLTEISKKENFYAFTNDEKGKKFIEENKEDIAKGLARAFFGYEGLGRVCKN